MAKKKTVARKAASKTKRKSPAKRKGGGGLSQTSYGLSSELQAVVGAKSLTRPQIVKKLWAYIKAHHCQDKKDRRMIVPDKKLEAVLGKKPIHMLKLAGVLNKHIK